MDPFSKLPDELLLTIFMHVEHPNRFSRTNKRFHGIACNTLNIVRWLKARYYENEMIYYALLHLGDRSEPVCEMLLQRATHYPDCLLFDLIQDARRRGDGKVQLPATPGQIGERFIRKDTAIRLYNCAKRHRSLAGGIADAVKRDSVSVQAKIEMIGLIRDYQPPFDVRDQQMPSALLLRNREGFVKVLNTYGSPIYSRAQAIDYTVLLFQRGHDVEWRLETFRTIVDFPSLHVWTFLEAVCDSFLLGAIVTTDLPQLQAEVRLGIIVPAPDRVLDRAVAKYLLQQNEVGLHRYGYGMLDSAIPRVRWGPGLEHCDALIWRAFLEATDRGSSMKEMVTRLLCSYRGVRLLEESQKFEACYLRYIRVQHKAKRAQTQGAIRRDPQSANSLSCSYHDCPLFVKSQAELDAFWLVLHLKNKISSIQAKDPDFLKARITFDSIIHVLAYPWLSSAELVAALSLAGLKLSKGYNLQTIIKRALKRVMRNAFCGMHLIELSSKLSNPVPLLERLIIPDTLDSILVYPEIDDCYSDDPLVAGLQGYKLDLPTRKASYSDMGPKVHLPLAFGLLEVLKHSNSPALVLLLERARQRKLAKILKVYESAGVCV